MKPEIPELGRRADNRIADSDLQHATILTIKDILFSRFKDAEWQQHLAKSEGKFYKSAFLSLSRATLAFEGDSAGIQPGLWPTVRNTRFFADRLPRLKVDFPRLEIPNDGALVSDAATREQNDDKPEQSVALEQQEIYLRSISAYKTVTNESLEDFGKGLEGTLIKTLLQAVMMRIDAQLIAGDGVDTNVLGVRNWTGIDSQSKGADATLLAAAKAAEKVYQAGYTPDLLLINPADWLAAVTTAAVDPFAVGNKLLGLNVCVSEASPSGLPTVMDTSAVYFLERSPITLMMSKTNEDNFIMNLTTLRAEQRVAVAITDVAAVCKVVA